MVELPAASNDRSRPPASGLSVSGVAQRSRVTGAAVAVATGLGAVLLLLAALADPKAAPVFGMIGVLAGVGALWAVAFAGQRGLRSDLDRLAAENSRAGGAVERAARAEAQLRDSEARYRALAGGRREVERALVEARRRAEAANEAKSRFLAAVSHEFRTPLNGILGLSALLRETALTADQETYARGVESSGEALLALVDDMLDFSKIESGRLDLHPEPTDIEALSQEIVELLAGRAHAKAIDVVADVAPLPPLMVDGARLRQVLLNLVGNGVKFTEAGGVSLAVRHESSDGIRVHFAVTDSGPGIAAADVERVFGEFEQGDTAIARRHGGAGLGLAISQRIVHGMGGAIAYRPGTDGGSAFTFALELPSAGSPANDTSFDLAGRQILVVAPPGPESEVISATLARCGAAPRLAATLIEGAALAGAAAAARLAYDAVLVDSRAPPDMSAALAALREAAGSRTPAVVLIEPTGRTGIDGLREAGFDAYLVRPVRRASLLRIIAEVTGGNTGFSADPGDRQPRRPPPRRAARSLDVLLAEDNEISALLARAVLESLGHRVTEVRDGAAAVAAVRESAGRFAAIVMDLHMPGLDGIAAARVIRGLEAESGTDRAAILALTADVLAETRAAASRAGIDAVLEKPVAPDVLRRAILAATAG
jgi:signal transduction histidine kinase/CheY-like chemotaxis protein